MRVSFTKLSDERHRLAIVRDDGSSESAVLVSRSFLLHDLVHYAIEAEVPIVDGFWGSLAAGTTLAELSERTMLPSEDSGRTPASPGLVLAERLVGPMQSLWNGRLDPAIYLEHGAAIAPTIVNAAFVERVRARLRALTGQWRATRFGEAMELAWPAP